MEGEMFERDWFSRPGDSVRYLMNRKGISPHLLASHIDGGVDELRGILSGTTPIGYEAASVLSGILGGPVRYWLKRQENYDRALSQTVQNVTDAQAEEWLERVPVPGPRPKGRLSEVGRYGEIYRRLTFYGVSSLEAWHVHYGRIRENTRFRTSPTYSSLDGPLSLWLRQGELEANMISTGRWNPSVLRENIGTIRKLSRISRPAVFLPKLREICAVAGIALVSVRAPRGCRVSGASRLVEPDKAMVLMSFRYRSDDHFWFTLFHELGHLLLHEGRTFVDDDRTDEADEYEWQANEFASSTIIPRLRESEFEQLSGDREAVLRFSVSIGVAAGLTVGQMQHRKMIGYDRLNSLKRRWKWDEIEAGLS